MKAVFFLHFTISTMSLVILYFLSDHSLLALETASPLWDASCCCGSFTMLGAQ